MQAYKLFFILLCFVLVSCSDNLKNGFKFHVWMTVGSTSSGSTTMKRKDWVISERFIRKEYKGIAEAASKGKGEHIETLAKVLGCPISAYDDFAGEVKDNYRFLFRTSSEFQPQTLISKLNGIILKNPILKKTCTMNLS